MTLYFARPHTGYVSGVQVFAESDYRARMALRQFSGGSFTALHAADFGAALEAASSFFAGEGAPPIDMILRCPRCQMQHVDAPGEGWTNPPHRSHFCAGCGAVWRPADVPTYGVQALRTRGERDEA